MIHFLSETNEASVASSLAVSSEVRSLLPHIKACSDQAAAARSDHKGCQEELRHTQ